MFCIVASQASPLLNFFRFHETFLVLRDYETCQGYLTSFKNTYRKVDRKSTRLNSSHVRTSRMPSSA